MYGGGSRAVRDVIVDGAVVLRSFEPVTMDPAEVRARAGEALAPLVQRAGI